MLRLCGAFFLIMIAFAPTARPARSQSALPPTAVTPAVIGSAPAGAVHEGVAVMGDYAYVYGSKYVHSPRMDVFAIADPTLPQLTATYTAPSDIYGIAATPTHLYLGTTQHGLRVLSLADPVHPVEVGAFTTFAAVLDVTLGPGYLLIAARHDGLRTLSLADPAHPAEIGGISWPTYAIYGWAADGIMVSGDVAYVSGHSVRSAISRMIRIIDLRDPTRPTDLTTESQFHVDTAYALTAREGFVYLGWGSSPSVSIADLRDPAAISTTGWVDVDPWARAGALFGNYLYVGCDGGVNGVNVVDVADPAAPTVVGTAMDGMAVDDLTLRGPYLYAVGPRGLFILTHGLALDHQLYLPAVATD